MSSTQLARLAALSGQRTEQRLRELTATHQEVSRLLQQHDELVAFANSYQTAGQDQASTLPAMLRVRRSFVGGVLDEVEKLEVRIRERGQVLEQQQATHRRSASEALALETLQQQAGEQESAASERKDRQSLDEAGSRRTMTGCATADASASTLTQPTGSDG